MKILPADIVLAFMGGAFATITLKAVFNGSSATASALCLGFITGVGFTLVACICVLARKVDVPEKHPAADL